MKTTLFIIATILMMTLQNNSFSQDFEETRVGYQVICLNDHHTKVTYVSNVFYCLEMPLEYDNNELVENKIEKELSSKTDGFTYFNIVEKEILDKRDEYIGKAKLNKYKVIFFDVKCIDGIVQ